MGMSFITSCPITGSISVPLQTVRTSTLPLFFRYFVRVSFDFAQDHELVEWHRFEAAYRLVFLRPALARQRRNMSLIKSNYLALSKG